jgi:Flagellar protein FliT
MAPQDFAGLCAEIAALTDEMVAVAKQQEWETVSALEFRRRTLFARAFAEHDRRPEDGSDLTEQLVQLIRKVLERDHEMIELGKAERKDVAAALGLFRDGRRAREAYGNSGV